MRYVFSTTLVIAADGLGVGIGVGFGSGSSYGALGEDAETPSKP